MALCHATNTDNTNQQPVTVSLILRLADETNPVQCSQIRQSNLRDLTNWSEQLQAALEW